MMDPAITFGQLAQCLFVCKNVQSKLATLTYVSVCYNNFNFWLRFFEISQCIYMMDLSLTFGQLCTTSTAALVCKQAHNDLKF